LTTVYVIQAALVQEVADGHAPTL